MKLLHISFALLLIFSLPARAQDDKGKPRRFSPQEFIQRQEAFIVKEVGLSTYEAANFFPLYHNMGKEKFELNRKIRIQMRKARTPGLTEKEYAGILEEMDKLQVEKVKLEADYHQKFRKVLPTDKVLRVIDADIKFDRMILKEMVRHRPNPMNMRNGPERNLKGWCPAK